MSNTNVQELEPVTTALGEIDVEDAILKRWEVVDEDQPTENSSEATSEEVIETDDQDVNEEEEIVQETDEELDEDPVEETEESEVFKLSAFIEVLCANDIFAYSWRCFPSSQ